MVYQPRYTSEETRRSEYIIQDNAKSKYGNPVLCRWVWFKNFTDGIEPGMQLIQAYNLLICFVFSCLS